MAELGLTRGTERPIVLVVEDEADASTPLVELLHSVPGSPFQLATAGSDAQVLDRLRDAPPDCVLMGGRPARRGLGLLLELVGEHGRMPCAIVLVGADDAQHAVAALRAGAHDYLSQAVTAEDLASSICLAIEEQAERVDASTATAAQEGFIRSLSHAARTPLTAVVGFSELLSTTDLDTRQREWTERIGVAGQHLLGLMDDMIVISHIASGKLELVLEAVPASEIVDECLGLVEPMTVEHGLVLRREHVERVELLADRQRLAQVLLNLFVNAVKYNRPGGSVTVRTRALESQARIEVIDTGHGIAPALVDRLFVPFERLDAPARRIPGTGLGLSISKALVEAMGGTIIVHSQPGEGSTFAVQVPLAA